MRRNSSVHDDTENGPIVELYPKIAMAPHGWWLPETEGSAPNLYGVFDVNVNQLIPMGKKGKAGYGGAPLKTMLCKIYPISEGDTIPTANTKMDRLDFTNSYDKV